jgi:hypothetical protein
MFIFPNYSLGFEGMGSELAINADKKNAATLTYIIVERSLRVLGVFAVPKNIAGASVLPALPF